ncbi:Mannose-1-phosphate guanyltransferase alpha [Schistosoma japonicum]|uniref:Mannose-1-phosphate guanyltransferase alpha n=1 Tax=Schistosoma japonicum TaxID=6182 RepID=A0A4Z2D4M5_SCHJA|nr:Mannose-1-phosphate guanyltransferase alpha [Schistosoma japonicum]
MESDDVVLTDSTKKIKAIILIGGPCKGTRFRPLSLELPKPLFPIAGFPVVYHHIEAFSKLPGLREIILLGFYQPNEALSQLISNAQHEFKVSVRSERKEQTIQSPWYSS